MQARSNPRRGAQSARSTVATASAATPSPRPVKPMPSLVVNLTFTSSGARPTASARWRASVPVRAEPGLLADHRGVEVANGPAVLAEEAADLGQQLDRVGVAPALVAVGVVLADVAQAGRAQQGVDDGVGEGVRVRAPVRPRSASGTSTPPSTSRRPPRSDASRSQCRCARSSDRLQAHLPPLEHRQLGDADLASHSTARSYSWPRCSGTWASEDSATGRPASRDISRKARAG